MTEEKEKLEALLQELFRLTKENHGDNSPFHLVIIRIITKPEYREKVSLSDLQRIYLLEKEFNEWMHDGLAVVYDRLQQQYHVDVSKLEKIEFGRPQADEHNGKTGGLIRDFSTNRLYTVMFSESPLPDKSGNWIIEDIQEFQI